MLLAGRLVVARTPVPHDGGRLAGKLALITAGALAVTVPWLVPFLWALGVGGLLREIFLVGTDFALVYATPYPIPFGFPDAWPLLVTGAGAVFALGGVAAMRGWIAPRRAACKSSCSAASPRSRCSPGGRGSPKASRARS